MKGRNSLSGPLADPAGDAGYAGGHAERVGFFTDTSVCIGCKACEVACKTWNAVPEDGLDLLGMSFDNTGSLGANSWRHVAFIEQPRSTGRQDPGLAGLPTGETGTALMAEAIAPLLRAAERGGSELGTSPLEPAHEAAHDGTAGLPTLDLGMPAFERPGDGPLDLGPAVAGRPS